MKEIKHIERQFNRFLWNGSGLSPAKSKVAWDYIYVPKSEGGLGLRKLTDWNRAAILKHIWSPKNLKVFL